MSKKKALILFISALLLGFLMIQPFNIFCRATDKCQPIILSYYMPSNVGDENFEIIFEAKNSSKDVKFEPYGRSMILASGEKQEIEYGAKNISDHDVKIRPTPYVYPPEAEKYIKFYECLCYREHKIKSGEDIKMAVQFKLKRAIEKDPFFSDMRLIRVGYEIK